jgi:predicted RNA-binding Zn ribbon-like protein
MQEQSSELEHAHFISEGVLCLDVMNSEHFDFRGRRAPQDHLQVEAWRKALIQEWKLPVAGPPDALAQAALQTLRMLMRQMVETMAAGQPVTEAQLDELNAFLALTPATQQLRRGGSGLTLEITPLHEGWTWVVTQVAVSWATLLTSVPAERIKVCANPDCRWVFVDQSHNLSRRWCRQWACGNLMKVRQFRARARRSPQ